MGWSNSLSWDRLVGARRRRATTEVCSRSDHSSETDSPFLFQNIMGRQAVLICTRCGRTFDEILDAEVERTAPKRKETVAA